MGIGQDLKDSANRECADRHNEGKPRLTFNLLGREVVELEARVWEYGAEKYAPGQWLKGLPLTSALDSLIRHATALLNGEDIDPESGIPHVGFLITNSKMIANSWLTRPDLDDRPKGAQADEYAVCDTISLPPLDAPES